jgi:hypothetical protein
LVQLVKNAKSSNGKIFSSVVAFFMAITLVDYTAKGKAINAFDAPMKC